MTRRVFVGVPESHARWPVLHGHGRLWAELIKRLPEVADLRLIPDTFRADPDVWLVNGHPEWEVDEVSQPPNLPSLATTAPLVVQLHEGALGVSPEHPETALLFEREFARATAGAVECADLVVTPSEFSRREILQNYDAAPRKVRVVPHGVDASVFRPGARVPSGALARAGLDPGRPFVLCVSAMYPRKNLRALRDAVTMLRARGFPHELVLVSSWTYGDSDGEGGRDEVFRPEEDGCPVHVVSGISDIELAGVFHCADVFCFPSLLEGFGLAPLEALACGTPCVVANTGALPEVVGDAAVLAAPNATDLARCLERILGDARLRGRLSEAGPRRARLFSWRRSIGRWADVLVAAAEGRAV